MNLCLACRGAGHRTSDCPQPPAEVSRSIRVPDDAGAVADLCHRCSNLKILDVVRSNAVRDEKAHWEFIKTLNRGRSSWDSGSKDYYSNLRFELGPAPAIELLASCPLCRLIFSIFPSNEIGDWSIVSNPELWYLRPYPPYDRTGRWAIDVPESTRSKYAVYFTVEIEHGEWRQRLEDSVGAMQGSSLAFAPAYSNSNLHRRSLAARSVPDHVDYGLLKSWLRTCREQHGVACQQEWDEKILLCRMIDVTSRQVVPCPPNCEYVALSYVWGGVQPVEGALRNKTSPQTIEDAITVTQALGLQYLWVDALCIDQTPTTSQPQQLSMMDLIYAYASVTIIALSGTNSGEGLPGVSLQLDVREQVQETIGDIEFLSVGVTDATLLNSSVYFTRAWTMQEALFSKRRLMFTDQQVHFMCNRAEFCEAINEADDPAKYLESDEPNEFWTQVNKTKGTYTNEQRRRLADEDYRQMVSNYTQRKMTNDHDAVNAFLGIENYLIKSWGLEPFPSALPLDDLPTALVWFHDRSVKQPCRRSGFPSWSWAGWEGVAIYDRALEPAAADESGDTTVDMTAEFLGEDEYDMDSSFKSIILRAWLVKLKIVTEPFSDAYTSDGNTLLGVVRERNFLHNNTIPSGDHEFLVVDRTKTKGFGGSIREHVDVLLLEHQSGFSERRTFARLSLQKGVSFETARPTLSDIILR